MKTTRIGIIGDYNDNYPLHRATTESIQHAARALSETITSEWLPTDAVRDYSAFQALWCSPGSPYRSLEGALAGIRFARENDIPFLGTCGGFQHAVLEIARSVLGIRDAMHAEYDPQAATPVVTPLSCSLVGKTGEIEIQQGSLAAQHYGKTRVTESFYCSFGLNRAYQETMEAGGLSITGKDASGEARIVELRSHPFFLATLFVPQANSKPDFPHPLILAFCQAARRVAVSTTANRSPAGEPVHPQVR